MPEGRAGEATLSDPCPVESAGQDIVVPCSFRRLHCGDSHILAGVGVGSGASPSFLSRVQASRRLSRSALRTESICSVICA